MKQLQYEIWTDIKGFEGYYQISSMGNVRSLDRYRKASHNSQSLIKGHILSLHLSRNGYVVADLHKNKKHTRKEVHRLVAEAFINNPDNLPEINHKDEDKTNNQISNLEWCTRSYNKRYKDLHIRKGITRGRQVVQKTLDGEIVGYWNSCGQIRRLLGLQVSRCLSGLYKTAYGYKWEYVEEG